MVCIRPIGKPSKEYKSNGNIKGDLDNLKELTSTISNFENCYASTCKLPKNLKRYFCYISFRCKRRETLRMIPGLAAPNSLNSVLIRQHCNYSKNLGFNHDTSLTILVNSLLDHKN